MHQRITDMSANSPLFELTLTDAPVKPKTDVTKSFLERLLAAYTVQNAAGKLGNTVVETDSDDIKSILDPCLESDQQLPSYKRIQIKMLPFVPGVATKTYGAKIVHDRGAEHTMSLMSCIFKLVDATFEDAMQASYFSSSKGLKTAMHNVVNHAVVEVVPYRRVHTMPSNDIRRIVQTKPIDDCLIEADISST